MSLRVRSLFVGDAGVNDGDMLKVGAAHVQQRQRHLLRRMWVSHVCVYMYMCFSFVRHGYAFWTCLCLSCCASFLVRSLRCGSQRIPHTGVLIKYGFAFIISNFQRITYVPEHTRDDVQARGWCAFAMQRNGDLVRGSFVDMTSQRGRGRGDAGTRRQCGRTGGIKWKRGDM